MPEAPATLYLVDGYALIYRAFFAMIARPLTTRRGENTSAAWGVTNFLLRLFERRRPDYLAWVHDMGESFRHQAYPGYKATREKLTRELQQDFDRSVERIVQILDAFHLPLIGAEGYEADDVIGTMATAAAARGLRVVIVSGDKDFYQLIGPGIALLNPGRGGPARRRATHRALHRARIPVPDPQALIPRDRGRAGARRRAGSAGFRAPRTSDARGGARRADDPGGSSGPCARGRRVARGAARRLGRRSDVPRSDACGARGDVAGGGTRAFVVPPLRPRRPRRRARRWSGTPQPAPARKRCARSRAGVSRGCPGPEGRARREVRAPGAAPGGRRAGGGDVRLHARELRVGPRAAIACDRRSGPRATLGRYADVRGGRGAG